MASHKNLAFPLLLLPGLAVAQVRPEGAEELLRQQQRERARQESQAPDADVRLDRPNVGGETARLPAHETPCFPIHRLHLTGEAADRFQWSLTAADSEGDSPIGRCLGNEGIALVMKRVQNAIVAGGHVTTRVLAPPQDLKSGELTLTVIPGRIRAIRTAPGNSERLTIATTFPMVAGDLLNLRDVEQALENLKRVPTAEADIRITPSEAADAQPGDSDLIVTWKQTRPFRLTLGLDDAGSKATGRYQGNLTVSADNLLTLSDLFYLTQSESLGDRADKGTRARTVHYSLPFGYWQLSLAGSNYTYHQTVAGASQSYIYRGASENLDLRLSRLVWRDAAGKTTVGARIWQRASHNFIDDIEVLTQERHMAGGEVNLGHRHFLGASTVDANLAYRWGTGALGSRPAPEEPFGEGSSRPRLWTADAQLNHPFQWLGQSLRYNLVWRAQWNDTPLLPQDRFAIAGRYTVRGFDGERLLSADRGWLIRNDLGITLGGSGQEAYLGLDHGRVGGQSAELLVGRELTGAVFGLRGQLVGVQYEAFVGRPIAQPAHFRTARTTAGFTLTWSI